MGQQQAVDFEQELEQELKMLQGWADSLANEARSAIPQIREAVHAEKMGIPSCPSRGALAGLCLSGVGGKLREVQGSLSRLNALVVNGDAPWNNRGDEKDWWKNG